MVIIWRLIRKQVKPICNITNTLLDYRRKITDNRSRKTEKKLSKHNDILILLKKCYDIMKI